MKRNFFSIISVSLILVSCSCNNNNTTDNNNNGTNNDPKKLNYTVVATYPHNTESYTEGLEWRNGFLYEGTGDTEYLGVSKLSKTDVTTGKDIQKINLSKDYFGEGITMLNGKIYQLTYKTGKCFVYDANTFSKLKEFTYEGEGWGLTNNGKELIMSNGSSDIVFRNPETFEIIKKISVSNSFGPLGNINELEYVDGFVFANIWTTYKIVKIDLITGKIVAEADFTDLLGKYAPDADHQKIDVFNGIAYDSVGKRFFVTGKYWPKVFEIKFN